MALRHADWHIFAGQRFRRRAGVHATVQRFRGEPYMVLSDRITGQHVRLAARAQELWRMLDGWRTAQEIWEDLMRRPASAPAQGELVDWLLQLVSSGLVLSDHELDPRHLTDRQTRRRSGMIEKRAVSPLAIKLRLFDPDPLVRATWPVARYLFTPAGAAAVAVLVLWALVQAVIHAEALVETADAALLSQAGALGLALAYPVMKAVHEFSHCYALYCFGGRVREFGVMFLVLFPVPYVEASEATALPDKRARMLVGAAGILAEVTIAAAALLLWLQLEPGLERAFLFNLMIIGSVSTLLFNGNPLLKFDAYYVLADWLEMPNLAQRSGDYLGDRFLSRIVGLRPQVSVPADEAPILATYGTLSLLYRLLLTLTIAALVSQWFYVVGLALAAWAVVMGLGWPLAKLARKGVRGARAQNRGRRAALRLMLFFVVLGGLAAVPLPFTATGEGQIVPRPGAQVVAATTGRVATVRAEDGARVQPGDVMVTLEDPEARARLQTLAVQAGYLEDAQRRAGLGPAERQRLSRERELVAGSLDEQRARVAALDVAAPRAGRLAWARSRPPVPGAFVFRGDVLAHVVAPDAIELVMALPASYAGRARNAERATVLLPDGTEILRPITRERVVDTGGQVPAELLASGGGPVPEQPENPGHALTTVWLAWAEAGGGLAPRAGMRFDVRLDLGRASAAEQVIFQLRRLFVRVIRV